MESCVHVFVHLVWATHLRHPLISEPLRRRLYPLIVRNAEKIGCAVLAVGGMEDHVHVAAFVHSTISVARLAQALKGATSYELNRALQPPPDQRLAWQEGYGAFSFWERDRSVVVDYIRTQRQRHARGLVLRSWEPPDWDMDELEAVGRSRQP